MKSKSEKSKAIPTRHSQIIQWAGDFCLAHILLAEELLDAANREAESKRVEALTL